MSDTVLSNRWIIYYLSETRQKRLQRDTSVSPSTIDPVKDLYLALQDHFDESSQMDDGVPMSAQTPTEYTIGIIDAGDNDPWFIDEDSVKYLNGGSLNSVSWARVTDSNTGIVHVPRTGSNIVVGDIGNTINNGTSTGTLLDINGNSDLVIRPTDSSSTHNWAGPAGTISCNGHNDSQNGVGTTGETIWANIYSLGTIDTSSTIYVVQNYTKITPWWSTGHIDILVEVQHIGEIVDSGILTVYIRKYGNLYDHYQIITTGGRNPIPLNSSADINNNTAEGTIAALTGITFTFGAVQKDIGDGDLDNPYDVLVTCGGNTLKNFYEYTKYITRRTSATSLNGHDGEQYITVGEIRLAYNGQTAEFTEGATLTGQTSGATGVIVANHDSGTSGTLILRDVRGTFDDTTPEEIRDDDNPGIANIVASSVESTLISKVAPLGTFAGGKFFGARGVWIENDMDTNDANNYELTDSNGDSHSPPLTVPVSVTVKDANNNAIQDALVYVQKQSADADFGHLGNPYTDPGSSTNQLGDPTYVVTEAIEPDNPSTGWIKVQDISTQEEQSYRYASWSGSTFTLNSEVTFNCTGGGTGTSLQDSVNDFTALDIQEGDTVRNTTDGSWAIVDEIVDADNITTTSLLGGSDNTWTSGDTYSFHRLAINYVSGDYATVPLILDYTNVSGAAGLSYSYGGDKEIDVFVRKSTAGETRYRPLKTVGTITNSGFGTTVVMTVDTIASP